MATSRYIGPTPLHCADVASAIIAESLEGRDTPVLGVATGSTPLLTYAALVARSFDASRLHLVLLDEYLGLERGDPRSFGSTIDRVLAGPLGVTSERIHVPPHDGEMTAASCGRFEKLLHDLGGVDLQLLGIGGNGHIGFNEPGSPFDSRTRVVELSDRTMDDNRASFGTATAMPTRACTQGIGTILEARQLLLLAIGGHKARILHAAMDGPITPSVPASAVRLHPRCTVIADAAAIAPPVG